MRISSKHALVDGTYMTRANPGNSEAWWWLGVPVAASLIVFLTAQWAPGYYIEKMQPEHTGWLERFHFLLPLAAGLVGLKTALRHQIEGVPLLRAAVWAFVIACLYWALEEESYGQHLFGWETPETWSAVNKQNETNLHNTSYFLAQLPRTLLVAGIAIGGLLLPLTRAWLGPLKPQIIDILTPPLAIIPASLTALLWKLLQDIHALGSLVTWPEGFRHGEANETFFAIFLLLYAVMLYRRTAMFGRGAR